MSSTYPYIIAAAVTGGATVIAATISAVLSYKAQRLARSIDHSVNGIKPGDATIRENVELLVEKQELAHDKFDVLAERVDLIRDEAIGIRRRIERIEKTIKDTNAQDQ